MGWTKEERAEYNKWYREHKREQIKATLKYYYQHYPKKKMASLNIKVLVLLMSHLVYKLKR